MPRKIILTESDLPDADEALVMLLLIELRCLSYLALLILVGRALMHSGLDQVTVLDRRYPQGRRSQSGVDLIANLSTHFGEIPTAVRVSASRQPIARSAIDSFRGAMHRTGFSNGIFVTTTTYSEKAKAAAHSAEHGSVVIHDGETLAYLLLETGIGVETIRDVATGTVTRRVDTEAFERLERFAEGVRTRRAA
jgi:restriction endonuclease Mrr